MTTESGEGTALSDKHGTGVADGELRLPAVRVG